MTQRKARSPWQRYAKRAFIYSPQLQAWDAALRSGAERLHVDSLATEHNKACARMHGPMPEVQGHRTYTGGEA